LASEPCDRCRGIKFDRLQALLNTAMESADVEHADPTGSGCGHVH
jgi:hypothetical protein